MGQAPQSRGQAVTPGQAKSSKLKFTFEKEQQYRPTPEVGCMQS